MSVTGCRKVMNVALHADSTYKKTTSHDWRNWASTLYVCLLTKNSFGMKRVTNCPKHGIFSPKHSIGQANTTYALLSIYISLEPTISMLSTKEKQMPMCYSLLIRRNRTLSTCGINSLTCSKPIATMPWHTSL